MGFGCDLEPTLPPFVVHIILCLSYIHRALTWALRAVGLAILLDGDIDCYAPAQSPSSETAHYGHQPPPFRRRPVQPISASLIRQSLPSSRYEPQRKDEREDSNPNSCSVCLNGLEVGDEVRRLGGCSHVFHACCIDRWVDIGRRTCPLCRAQLMTQELLREATIAAGKVSGDTATDMFDLHWPPLDAYYYDELYNGNDGDCYPLLQDEFDDFVVSDHRPWTYGAP